MKLGSPLALLVAAAVANAVPQGLKFQDSAAQQQVLQDHSVHDSEHLQDVFEGRDSHLTRHGPPPASPAMPQEPTILPNPFPGHRDGPDSTLDFSHLTILEIVNASLGRHHEHGETRFSPAVIDEKDPSHLPLHRLAWLVNFSIETQEYLQKDDITLLAPDDRALTPPHRREHPHDSFELFPFEHYSESVDFDKSRVAHPFHAREFSPKKLRKLASVSEDGDDKEKERKREIFRKIISYVGKYHVIPGRRQAHDLADISTAATLLEDSRLRVSSGLDWRPLPHPTIKFNYYVSKRGPTILAKNGIIHLVSAPLAPPFGPLNELFLFPTYFSSLTSDVQRVGLDEDLLPPHAETSMDDVSDAEGTDEDEESSISISQQLVDELTQEKEVREYTVFAPSNFAYARVPTGLNVALHFPFPLAKKVLKYITAAHIVPDVVFFSDFLKNDTSSTSLAKFETTREENVVVPLEWLNRDMGEYDEREVDIQEAQPLTFISDEEVEPRRSWMPTFPRWARRSSWRRPPPPPREDHPPGHPGANVTHYELPTLLTPENAKATLKVAVVAYRVGPGGKGPIRRSVIVFPHRPEHQHHHERPGPREDKKERRMMCPHEDPFRPIKAIFGDFPAKSGAIHVLPRVIPPPPPPHHGEDYDFSNSFVGLSSKTEVKKLRKALARIF